MMLNLVPVGAVLLLAIPAWPVLGQTLTPNRLELLNVKAEAVTYRGRAALRIADALPNGGDDGTRLAIVSGTSFLDGTIEVALSGDIAPNAPPFMRGFVGIAFRLDGHHSQYECFYIRTKNGRSEDQLQRNHATQYISVPGFPWERLRSETPGKYESYVDLIPGEWTKLRIQVTGARARLFIGDASEPVLIVNDLKQKPLQGPIALWLGPGTIAHFADLKVTP